MSAQPESLEGDNLLWLHEHMKELSQYQGQWVGVIGRRVVAAGATVDDVIDQVVAQGLTSPLVTKIPDDVNREFVFIG